MQNKRFLQKVVLMFVVLATFSTLAACGGKNQAKEPAFPSTTFVSSTDLFGLYVPAGWSTQEIIPGADLVVANSAAALERYSQGSAIESSDVVLNVGFLPLALLREKELAHLGIQFEAPPDVFLQSLLPMFRVGAKPASGVVGDVTLVSLADGRDAGMLTFSEDGREGLVLVFTAGDDVVAFISATTFPGGLQALREVTYPVAAGVAYSGSQKALYQTLYGD